MPWYGFHKLWIVILGITKKALWIKELKLPGNAFLTKENL